MRYFAVLFFTFALTAVTELLVVLFMQRDKRVLLPCVLGNLCTNPLLNVIWSRASGLLPRGLALACLAGLEICAVLYEGEVYHLAADIPRKRSMLLSLAANAVSFSLGAAIYGI